MNEDEKDEKEYIETFKKMTDQDRNDLYINLKHCGRTNSEIALFKNHYEKYLTKKVDI